MSKPKTVEQWLKEKDLPTELGRVLEKGPYSHDFYGGEVEPSETCLKCKLDEDTIECFCSVPDPITIDWNTAKYWQGQCKRTVDFDFEMETIFMGLPNARELYFTRWYMHDALPKHYLIAAAMAAERKEE